MTTQHLVSKAPMTRSPLATRLKPDTEGLRAELGVDDATRNKWEEPSDNEAGSHLPPITEAGDGGSSGELRLHSAAQPGFLETRRARGDRREARLAHIQQGRPHGNDAQQGR